MDFLKENLNTIIEGDCLEKLKDFPNKSVDFIFADPPYFMQTEGELKRFEGTKFQGVEDHWDKFGSFKEYDTFCLGWLKHSQPHRFLYSRPLKYRASFLKGVLKTLNF